MSKISALSQEEFKKASAERMKELKEGIVHKVNPDVVGNFERAVKRGGILLDEDLKKINGGVVEFNKGAKVKKINGKWKIKSKGLVYECIENKDSISIKYPGSVKKLKKLNRKKIKMMLVAEVVRRDNDMFYKSRKGIDGTQFSFDPTAHVIEKYGSKERAKMKMGKRLRKYRERIEVLWNDMVSKAKKEKKKSIVNKLGFGGD